MTQYEHKVNRGSLFKNDRRERAEQPGYRGTINVDGRVWEISAWVSETKGGDKYFSLQVKPPYVKPGDREAVAGPVKDHAGDFPSPPPPEELDDDLDSDIPFK